MSPSSSSCHAYIGYMQVYVHAMMPVGMYEVTVVYNDFMHAHVHVNTVSWCVHTQSFKQ